MRAPIESLTQEELAELLREAAKAHHAYEQGLAGRDEDWPGWYAAFILERLRSSSSPDVAGRSLTPPGER